MKDTNKALVAVAQLTFPSLPEAMRLVSSYWAVAFEQKPSRTPKSAFFESLPAWKLAEEHGILCLRSSNIVRLKRDFGLHGG